MNALMPVEAPVLAASPIEQMPDALAGREQALRQLLDGPYAGQNFGNYDYARDSGLLNEFYFDPTTGRDGAQHILAGEMVTADSGAISVQGFHHEPSGATLQVDGEAFSTVDRQHLQTVDSRHRAEFREPAFEPYRAKVDIAGYRKFTTQIDRTSGEREIVETNNSMFPKEYDGLAVLQAVRIAKQTRDRTQDTVSNGRIMATGAAVMVDNASPMRIRMFLDPQTEQVIAAMPMVKPSGIMKLGQESIDHFVYGDGASVKLAK